MPRQCKEYCLLFHFSFLTQPPPKIRARQGASLARSWCRCLAAAVASLRVHQANLSRRACVGLSFDDDASPGVRCSRSFGPSVAGTEVFTALEAFHYMTCMLRFAGAARRDPAIDACPSEQAAARLRERFQEPCQRRLLLRRRARRSRGLVGGHRQAHAPREAEARRLCRLRGSKHAHRGGILRYSSAFTV